MPLKVDGDCGFRVARRVDREVAVSGGVVVPGCWRVVVESPVLDSLGSVLRVVRSEKGFWSWIGGLKNDKGKWG